MNVKRKSGAMSGEASYVVTTSAGRFAVFGETHMRNGMHSRHVQSWTLVTESRTVTGLNTKRMAIQAGVELVGGL